MASTPPLGASSLITVIETTFKYQLFKPLVGLAKALLLLILNSLFFSFQDLRCNKLLQQGTAFAHDVYICQFCSTRRGAFGDVFQLNRDSCFICGRFTTWKDDQRSAMVCHFHKPPPGPPNVKMCILCRKPAFQNAVKCYLCPMCGTVGIKKCAMLVGNWSHSRWWTLAGVKRKIMNLSSKTWKDIVYTVVSAGVFCRTHAYACLVAVSFYMLERTPLYWDYIVFGTQTKANMGESNRKQTSLNRALRFLQNIPPLSYGIEREYRLAPWNMDCDVVHHLEVFSTHFHSQSIRLVRQWVKWTNSTHSRQGLSLSWILYSVSPKVFKH